MTLRLPFLLALLLLFPVSFAAAAPAQDPVVAKVNGIVLHRSDVVAAQQMLPPQARSLPLAQIYPLLLNELVDTRLVAEAGLKEHLDKDPDVKQALARAEDQLVARAYLRRAIAKATTEEALKAAYQTYLKEHPAQEEVHASHILVKTKAEAQSIIAQLEKGAHFGALAKKYSTDTTAKSGGDLGYFTRNEMVPAFANAAFALPVGGYTKEPVETQFGWHVIKVRGRRMQKPPSLAQARPELQNMIAREVVQKTVKALRASAKIETFDLAGKPLPEKPVSPRPAPAATK